MRLLILAQTPPPVHGQSVMVRTLVGELPRHGIASHHVNLPLSRSTADIGRWQPMKVVRLLGALARTLRVRYSERCDCLYYVPAPGKRGALYRDWLVMLVLRPFFPRLVLHWHAAGLGDWLEQRATTPERVVTRALLGRPDLSIVLANSLRNDAEVLASRRIKQVTNGVPDPGALSPPPPAPPSSFQVLFIGLCSAEKGVFLAAEAVIAANAEGSGTQPGFTLVAAGPFPDRETSERFDALVRRHPDVIRHAGMVAGREKTLLYQSSHAVCLPTTHDAEALPLVLLEALAHDRPIVASNWRGIGEIASPDVGYVVEPANVSELVRAFRSLRESPPRPGACRERFLKHYTVDRHVAAVVDALSSLEEPEAIVRPRIAESPETVVPLAPASTDAAETAHDRVTQGYRSTLLSHFVRVCCKVVSVTVLARLVAPAEHGLFAMAASLTLVLVLFRDLGLGTAAIQASHLSEVQKSTLAWAHAVIGVILSITAVLLAPGVAAFYHEPRVEPVVVACSLGLLLIGLNAWPRVLLMRDMRFGELNRLETLAAVVATMAMVVAGAAGAGAFAFVVFLLVSESIILVEAWRVCGWRPRHLPRWHSLQPLWRSGAGVTAQQVLVFLQRQAEIVFVGRWFGAHPLGNYSRPAQLLAMPATHMAGPLAQVLLATLSRTEPRDPQFLRQLQLGTNLILHLTLPVVMLCFALPHEVVRLVLGPEWLDAAPLLRWLALAAGAGFLAAPMQATAVALHRTSRLGCIEAATLVLVVGGIVAGRPHGPEGIAAGVAAALLVSIGPRWYWLMRGTDVRVRSLVRAAMRPVIVNTVGAIAAMAAVAAVDSHEWPTHLAVGAFSAAAAMGIACLGWPALRNDIMDLGRRLSPFSSRSNP